MALPRGAPQAVSRLRSLYCDGSAQPLAGGPGGWAFVVVHAGESVLEGMGAESSTTSVRMELQAALSALTAAVAHGWHREPLELVSDSRIALDVANGTFLPKPPADRALALALQSLNRLAQAKTRWVRAHQGERWNEHVDARALEAKLAAPKRRRKKVSAGTAGR